MATTTKAVELIVSGRVQRVGYRDFVTDVGRALKLVGFVQNLPDGTVKIRCKGGAATVRKFEELINVKNPPEAPLIDVESIAEKQLKETEITEALFEERYGDPNVELLQAVSTGTKYIGHLSKKIDGLGGKIDGLGGKIDGLGGKIDGLGGKIDGLGGKIDGLGDKIDDLSAETRTGFSKMDTNFQELNVKYGKISTTMERIDNNIEKIATKKKGIFE